ncbi:hypothetical protein NDU88_007460 [Pleurodeles waltl]|uniref:Uncharacterized protein n=1 Tax=Pleurodeles waltl TaxID=8319 RepID=A0AAV7LXR8_PLEWA|nr:hypothetical protein NDU88_007460 [Pleurodeles waltl]
MKVSASHIASTERLRQTGGLQGATGTPPPTRTNSELHTLTRTPHLPVQEQAPSSSPTAAHRLTLQHLGAPRQSIVAPRAPAPLPPRRDGAPVFQLRGFMFCSSEKLPSSPSSPAATGGLSCPRLGDAGALPSPRGWDEVYSAVSGAPGLPGAHPASSRRSLPPKSMRFNLKTCAKEFAAQQLRSLFVCLLLLL